MNISAAANVDTERDTPFSLRTQLSRMINRERFQLLIVLIIGLVLPALIIFGFPTDFGVWWSLFSPTIFSTGIAIILGFLILRKMSFLPGFSATSNVIPAFVLSFGFISSIYFGLRLDFGRNLFLLSFLFVVFSQLAIMFALSRLQKRNIGVIPGGRTSWLINSNSMKWVMLNDVKSAQNCPNLAIAVDLNSDTLSAEWEAYLAEEILKGRRIYNAKQLAESIMGRVQSRGLSENYDGHLALDAIYNPMKYYIDIIGAIIALILLSPLMLITAALIRLDSKGPILFIQERIGYQGKPFRMIKFRSMRLMGEGSDNIQSDITKSHDVRITKIGRFIRKTRIDELPQLFNIIRGEMSWIGPRPETSRLAKWYAKEIPYYSYRHILRPGITGWAQVRQGHVTDLNDIKKKFEFDLYYIKHFSIWLDITIALQTLRIVLTGSGAK